MKDPIIEKTLIDYAEAVKPPADRFLAPVFYKLRFVRRAPKRAADKIFARIAAGAIAATVALVLVINYILPAFGNILINPPAKINPYSLASLAAAKADGQLVAKYGELFPVLPEGTKSDKVYTSYKEKEKNETRVISLRCRFLSEAGIIEFVAYADIGGKLKDYGSFARLPYYGDGARLSEEAKDGEYYTNIYYKKSDTAVYVLVMSSAMGAGEYLVNGDWRLADG